MSLHQLANHMSAQGRGPDSTLVHMSPREVSGLQSLAMAHGGSLTVNPQTGLPEAGFLDRLLPTLLGGAATFFSGGTITPLMAAMGVGGLTALTSKDLGKGLMAGLGAYGGGSIVSGLAEFGTGALSAEAGKAAIPAGMDPLGYEAEQLSQNAIAPKLANASYYDKLAAGASNAMTNPRGALSAVGGGSELMGAAKIAAPLMSALSGKEATSVPTFGQIAFDPRAANISIRREQNPYQEDTGSSAQRGYFGRTYVDRNAADGGFVSDGGIERFASGGDVGHFGFDEYGRQSGNPDFGKPSTTLPKMSDGRGYADPRGGISIDPIKPPLGGIPLDPNYDYSGYGRKPQARVAPVVQPKAVPKPDFVGADGKTYRYDPMKKSWYVFKDVPEKTNPGVATLMGNEGLPGNDVANVESPYAGRSFQSNLFDGPLAPLGIAAGMIGNAFSTPKTEAEIEATPVEDRTGVPTQAGIDYGKTGFGKTGDPDQDVGPAAPSISEVATTSAPSEVSPGGVTVDTTGPAPGGGDVAEGQGVDVGGVDAGGVDAGVSGGADSAPGGDGLFAAGGLTAFASGGLGSLGGYSDGGRLLRGPGDGVSDSIPATVGNRQPARLADGEFVIPARIVSELGNGSTAAGARALYKMMDRIQANRRKTTGKNSVAVNSKSHKYLPA